MEGMGSWRTAFTNGLVVLTPFLVTFLVLGWLYRLLVGLPVFTAIQPPMVRVAVLLVVFTSSALSVGYLMRTTLGTFLDRTIDAVFELLPGARVVHLTVKHALKTVILGSGVTTVKVDLGGGIRIPGFQTGKRTPDGRVIVFIPGAPDVSSGLVAEVEDEDVLESDESIGDLLIRQASCGFADVNQRTDPLRPSGDDR